MGSLFGCVHSVKLPSIVAWWQGCCKDAQRTKYYTLAWWGDGRGFTARETLVSEAIDEHRAPLARVATLTAATASSIVVQSVRNAAWQPEDSEVV